MVLLIFALKLLVYLAVGRLILSRLRGTPREVAFAVLNTAACGYFLFLGKDGHLSAAWWIYLAIVLCLYATMTGFSDKPGWKPWLAFFTPILVLVVIRYVPTSIFTGLDPSLHVALVKNPDYTIAASFIGISYLAFRCSHLVLEVRNGIVPKPGFWPYLGYCFFVPTMMVGPINVYSHYRRGFAPDAPSFPTGRCLLRILVGLVKFMFLGTVFSQLSYSGLLLDDHLHPWMDLPVAAVAYYLYLYCNFSGFCDIAIGGAGLIGIPVNENFRDPLLARNMREFWNRWHITLSQYMRDVVFSPLSKYLAQLLGPAWINLAIALTVLVVFLLIGIWHGTGWNYAVFGLLQGVGVIATHYYTLALKRWLGRDGFKAYNENPFIHAVAVVITFSYYAMTLFFFANSPEEIRTILAALR